jgi:signal transduction histidine kinase
MNTGSTSTSTDLATVAEDAMDAAAVGNRAVHLDLRPAPLSGDPVLLERLAANLIDNALRYNFPGGTIWVTTATRGGNATLTVANTGPVIDPAAIDGLFQPFRRLENRTSRDGFGLGLAIVASIAVVHRGMITANPRAAGGLDLTVAIPAVT